MFPHLLLHFFPICLILTLSSALTIPTESSIVPFTASLSSSNDTSNPAPSSPTPNVSVAQIHCDGSAYKRNVLSASCLDAISTIPEGTEGLTIGDRDTGGDFDIELPYRWISADGFCIFDIAKPQRLAAGYASTLEFSNAAKQLRNQCLGNGGAEGGIAVNLGFGGKLGLIMTSYAPSVRCSGPPGHPLDSCNDIVTLMPTTSTAEIFGRSGQSGVTVEIPDGFDSEDDTCKVKIDSTAQTDVATWYELWEAVVAVDGMCGRFGMVGTAFSLGARKSLNVDLTYSRAPVDNS